ncbi:MAG TPA: hypothetical protein VII30_02180 [Gemmatimonadaceae bacterium]
MATEHDDDGAAISLCRRYRVYDAKEIARDQDVGERFEERGEAPVLAWRRRKLRGGNLVRAPLDRNGADFREIGFRDGTRAAVTAYWLGDGK